MASNALRSVSNVAVRRSGGARLRFEPLENRLVLSTVTLSSADALELARETIATYRGVSNEELRSAVPASTLQAFGSQCNYEWMKAEAHGCYSEKRCEPEPQCDPVPLSRSREWCETPCETDTPSVASLRRGSAYDECERDRWCDPVPECAPVPKCDPVPVCEVEVRRESKQRCEDEPPCDPVPLRQSSWQCEPRCEPVCEVDVRREREWCEVKETCDPYQNGAKSERGNERCYDPCENTDVRRQKGGEQACEVRDRCETVRRCDPKPDCNDNPPASVARENGAKSNGAAVEAVTLQAANTGGQGTDTLQRIAQSVDKLFGAAGFANQVSRWL